MLTVFVIAWIVLAIAGLVMLRTKSSATFDLAMAIFVVAAAIIAVIGVAAYSRVVL